MVEDNAVINSPENDTSLRFYHPLSAKMANLIRQIVEKNGGVDAFLGRLEKDPVELAFEFHHADRSVATEIGRFLTDKKRQYDIIQSSRKDDAIVLSTFANIGAIDDATPSSNFFWFKSTLESLLNVLREESPFIANEIMTVFSVASLDLSREALYVKSALRLGNPKKSLGRDDVFVVSTSFLMYLRAIEKMVRSIDFADSELALINLRSKEGVTSQYLDVIEKIEAKLASIRINIQAMGSDINSPSL